MNGGVSPGADPTPRMGGTTPPSSRTIDGCSACSDGIFAASMSVRANFATASWPIAQTSNSSLRNIRWSGCAVPSNVERHPRSTPGDASSGSDAELEALQDTDEVVHIEGLRNERRRAEPLGPLAVHRRGERGHHHDARPVLDRELLELLEHRPPVHPRHHDIQHHEIGVVAFDLIHRLEAVVGGEGLVPLTLQTELDYPDDLGLVVDDEDGGESVRSHVRSYGC